MVLTTPSYSTRNFPTAKSYSSFSANSIFTVLQLAISNTLNMYLTQKITTSASKITTSASDFTTSASKNTTSASKNTTSASKIISMC